MKVLYTDAHSNAALVAIRSLGAKGIQVYASDYRKSLGFYSKYTKGSFIYPSPLTEPTEFIEYILKKAETEGFEVVYPVHEFTTPLISKHKGEFPEGVKVAVPDFDILMLAHDKSRTEKYAKKAKIKYPKTVIPKTLDELDDISEKISYPAVVKPKSKVTWRDGKASVVKVTRDCIAQDKKHLIEAYQKIHERSSFPLIQEYIEGIGYGVSALVKDGNPKAAFVHKRLREYPTTGGASTLRVSVKDDNLMETGLSLLENMKWDGLAMAEFKVTTEGEPVLMEVNGRFWGSIALAVAAGVDFPYLYHKMLCEGDVEEVFDYKENVMCRWLIPLDIMQYIAKLRQGDIVDSTRDFFKFKNIKDDIISADDPYPTVGAVMDCVNYAVDVLSGKRRVSGETG
ncbi:MAG: ATP-grasp domain-containing protein [Candidatus Altiarchaeota archaeon]|nr:ATP-grasp domain-containing protein [Candidatus Altiarchaeota archaeon]